MSAGKQLKKKTKKKPSAGERWNGEENSDLA